MIVRAVLSDDPAIREKLLSDFDHFNDFKDTRGWLGMMQRHHPERSEEIQGVIDRLEKENDAWWKRWINKHKND